MRSGKADHALRLYLEMGADRSLAKLATALGHRDPRHLERWSAEQGWAQLAVDHDAAERARLEAAKDAALEAAAAVWAERTLEQRESLWQLSQALKEKAETMLMFPLQETKAQDGKTIIKPARWNLRTAGAFLDLSAKLGQLATNQPTDLTNGNLKIRLEYEDVDPQAPAAAPGANQSDSRAEEI